MFVPKINKKEMKLLICAKFFVVFLFYVFVENKQENTRTHWLSAVDDEGHGCASYV